MNEGPASSRRPALASVLGLSVGGLFYLAVLLDFRWAPGRTAIPLRYASNFFDLQANALLNGHLDVPTGSLGIEGFVVDGRTYMYFPPFPALVRIPVMLVTHAFDGRLTVASMAVAWLVFAVFSARLLWLVRRLLHSNRPVGRTEAVGAGTVLAAVAGGTVLTFDAALPWVYHEVYLWAAATVVGAMYWLARAAMAPSRWTIGWLAFFALAAVLTRTTGGFAVCGAILFAAAWAGWRAHRTGVSLRPAGTLAAAGFAPLLAGITLNLVKFDHPYLFPLQQQVWSGVNSHRRDALLANGGTITGPQFLPTTATAYFRPDGLRLTDYYPWVSLPARPPQVVGDVVFDQTYRTASVTATTPLLLVLALAALVVLVRVPGETRRVLLPPLLGSAAVGGGVLMYGYISNRYTSEFVPGLVVGSTITAAALLPLLSPRRRAVRAGVLAALAVFTAYSLLVQTALGYREAAVHTRGERLTDFLNRQRELSGGPGSPQAALVRQVTALPVDPSVDTLGIIGDCSALYLATGDTYEPWALVQARPVVLEFTAPRELRNGAFPLATVVSSRTRSITVETGADNSMRVVVSDGAVRVTGPWVGVYPGTTFRIGWEPRSDVGQLEVTTTPGGRVAFLPWRRVDADWVSHPGEVRLNPALTKDAGALGITVDEPTGRSLSLCRALAADAS